MEVGADLRALDDATHRFATAANDLRSAAIEVDRSNLFSARFGAIRNSLNSTAVALKSSAVRCSDMAAVLHNQRTEQERVSGDRASFGSTAIRRAPSLLVGGVPRISQARIPFSLARFAGGMPSAVAVGPWADFLKTTKERSGLAKDTIEFGQGISRAFLKSPRGPRTIRGLLTMRVDQASSRFAMKGVSAATRAKYLKQAGVGGVGIAGVVASILLQRSSNVHARLGGAGLGKGLDVWASAKIFNDLRGLSKISRPAKVLGKVGGAFAVFGGVVGLVEDYQGWRAGGIKGKGDVTSAVAKTAAHGAMAVGGTMMLAAPLAGPAAPVVLAVGGAVVLGASVVEAGAWIYDNRKQIAATATSAARAVSNGAAKLTTAVTRNASKLTNSIAKGATNRVRRLFAW